MSKRKLTFEQAIEKLMSYCSKKERSRFDVQKKLYYWDIDSDKSEEIIQKLIDEGFISDERFIEAFIRGKYYYNKWGRVKIKYNLKLKGFKENDINPALDAFFTNVDYKAMVCEQLQKKNKSLKVDDEYQRKSKLIQFGQSRGYETELSLECVDTIFDS
ncbi:MAG: regulatory protein RecX [Bacteroidales bacterium]